MAVETTVQLILRLFSGALGIGCMLGCFSYVGVELTFAWLSSVILCDLSLYHMVGGRHSVNKQANMDIKARASKVKTVAACGSLTEKCSLRYRYLIMWSPVGSAA